MEEKRSFLRPTSVPKRVWLRYKSFRVEEIPDDKREAAVKHFMGNFFQDEPLSSILKKSIPYSDKDIKQYVNNTLNENMSIWALDEDNNDEIAGVTILRVLSRAAPHKYEQADSSLTSMKRLMTFLKHCYEGVDKFTYHSGSSKVIVDHILEPMGLSVARQYRGKGIGQALVQARHKMATEFGIGATMGIYTSIFSQRIILQQGMETVKEVPYADYLENGVAIFAMLNPPHLSTKVIGGLLPKESF